MRLRIPYEVLACLFVLQCGGSIFSPGGSDDGGSEASTGKGGAQSDGGPGGGGGTSAGGGGAGGSSGGSGGTSGTGGTGGKSGAAGTGGSGTGGVGGTGTGSGGTAGRAGGTGSGGVGGTGTGGGGTAGRAGGGGAGTGGSAGTADSGIDWGACTGGGQCVRGRKGCCDPCGVPELDTFAGVNSMYLDAFKVATCPVPTPCPDCPAGVNPNIAARCVANRCEPFDVRKVPEYSGCAVDGDCRLRNGLKCCEPCNGVDGEWVAANVSSALALEAALCVAGASCPPCVPVPPVGMRAVCKAGYCQVEPPCTLPPRVGCCFSDATCSSGHCYGATCTAGSEGMCKTRATQNECWGDRDCPTGTTCKNFSICPCQASCLGPDKPGVCG